MLGAEESKAGVVTEEVFDIAGVTKAAKIFLRAVAKTKNNGEWGEFYRKYGRNNHGALLVKEMRRTAIISLSKSYPGLDRLLFKGKFYLEGDSFCDVLVASCITGSPRRTRNMTDFEALAIKIPPVKKALQESNAGIKAAEIKAERKKGGACSCPRIAARRVGLGCFMKSNLLNGKDKEVEL